MEDIREELKHVKKFKPTSWAIDNRTTMFIVAILITLVGLATYNNLPKERFPDIEIPTISVVTAYSGASPAEIENLITRPIEKQIKGVQGVRKVTSSSMQDVSLIIVEFNTNTEAKDDKQRVKDAVDKSARDLPAAGSLTSGPTVSDFNLSDLPIMYVNVSGDYEMQRLKDYAKDLKDRFESLPEISRVDIAGALEREVQINVDLYKMQAAKLTFYDISNAIRSENANLPGGSIKIGDVERQIRVVGQFTSVEQIANLIVRTGTGAPIILKDIADVRETYEERKSYARLDHKPVITLNIVKRSGQNLVDASDKIRDAVKDMQENYLPKGLEVVITGDQSTSTRNTLNDLVNTIIIGFILVTLILMFFMGTTNAIFVALSVPLSSFLAFMVMPMIGGLLGFHYSLNMIVLFSMLLALGIVVDDAIVVIENTHRIFNHSILSIKNSAKFAAGEVFIPVLSGTLTTLAPFFPLLFWPGIVGKFMFYLPLTLILALLASLIVAFILNPVFAVSFMKKDEKFNTRIGKGFRNTLIVFAALAALFYISGSRGMGNLTIFIALLIVLNKFLFNRWIHNFQENIWPRFMNFYEGILRWALHRPWTILLTVIGLLILSFIATGIRQPKVVFFPQGDPNFIYTYITLPVGTKVSVTDSVTREVEKRVYEVIGEHNPDVESVITNVAVGAGDAMSMTTQAESHKGKVGIAFKEFGLRQGPNTKSYMDKIREKVKGIPAATITVEQERAGPPTGKPISIEISGDDYLILAKLSKQVKHYVDSLNIGGVEDLRSDLEDKNPELRIDIDRARANFEGVSTGQIANEIRTAIFGLGPMASKFKKGEEEFPIEIRLAEQYRKNVDDLLNMKITYRDMVSGQFRQIPVSAVAKIEYTNTYGAIKRKNMKRVITLSSNVLSGFTPNEVVGNIKSAVARMNVPQGYTIKLTGEQEDQKETGSFLASAGLAALFLILMVLVLQFNSISKPLIIISEIIFSTIGVLLGFSIFNMSISIVMTGVGIVALAGIVVKNGILLVEFSDVLKSRGHRTVQAVVEAGRTRLTPVLLTAMACILGLVPLAIGMNINFFTLFSDFRPDFYVGGESQVFWGPLAWTIIFGLSFATFLTLVVVPVMYLLIYKFKIWLKRRGVLPHAYKM